MNVVLRGCRESEACTWCERTKECVVVRFDDGFIGEATLCWRCLKQAVKVRSRTDGHTVGDGTIEP